MRLDEGEDNWLNLEINPDRLWLAYLYVCLNDFY